LNSPLVNRIEKIHPLTSLRFFAAFLVVLFHTLFKVFPAFQDNFMGRSISVGFVSVSFFFLLSGYILAVVYLRGGGPLDHRKFFAARFARVYPLFLVTLVLDAPMIFLREMASEGSRKGLVDTATMFAGSTVMLQAWFLRFLGIDVPNWSLSVETFFYLSFPLLGSLLWRLRGARIWLTALLIYAGGEALVWGAFHYLSEVKMMFVPLLHLSTFALGILWARWQMENGKSARQTPVREWQVYAVLAGAAAVFACVVNFLSGVPGAYLQDGLLAPIFLALIWAVSSTKSWISRVLSLPWLVILGEASYGLYLIHIPVWHLVVLLHLDKSQAAYPAYLAVCVGLSVLSLYFLEKPARRALLGRLAVRPRESMEAASDAQ
jgi:peptidoglycan/LPS O-acetylase OafA/YrhL